MINPRFLRPSSLLFGTSDFVQVGIVAVPLTLVIIAGGIDVSFASTVGLAAIAFGIANFFGLPLPLSLAVGLATGAAAGLLNATIIRLTRLQPLVVTLGSLYMFSGAATVLSGVVGASGYEGIGGFPETFTALGYAQVLGLPMPLVVFLVFAAVLLVLLHLTRFGRLVFQIGQNAEAARHSGMPVFRVQLVTYVLTGLAAALAGLMLSAYFGSARVDLGSATLLPAITAAVLGGASIYGGQGLRPRHDHRHLHHRLPPAGPADERRAEPDFQRAVRGAAGPRRRPAPRRRAAAGLHTGAAAAGRLTAARRSTEEENRCVRR